MAHPDRRLPRVVVVDDDPNIRSLLQSALEQSEFEVHPFADPRDALMKLHDLHPALIVCDMLMPDMDGRTFLKVVRKSEHLSQVPFIFLSGVQSNDEIVASLDGGADDFVSKPFHVARFVAKVRATLRMAERRRDALSGMLSHGGTLALMKFCEDSRLTGRLTVEGHGQKRWAEFLGGEILQAGGTPEKAGEEALDSLLAMEKGVYRIEQKGLDRSALQTPAPAAASEIAPVPAEKPAEGPAPIPAGRLSMVEVRGEGLQIQTEGENKPNFTVTTVIVRAGHVVRKIESGWQHPFHRRPDHEMARCQIDRQHDRVVASLQELSAKGPAPAPVKGESVDASLLAWALSFIGEHVRDHLGAVMTVALLRRTHRMQPPDAHLRAFRIRDDCRVEPPAVRRLPSEAVKPLAAWAAAFIEAAGEMAEKARDIRVHQVTRLMEAELEKAGFYAAFDAAVAPPRA